MREPEGEELWGLVSIASFPGNTNVYLASSRAKEPSWSLALNLNLAAVP